MGTTPEERMRELADDLGKQQNNTELNIQSNSSVTDGSLVESDDPTVNGDTSWRDAENEDQNTDTVNAPKNLDIDEDFAKTANE